MIVMSLRDILRTTTHSANLCEVTVTVLRY